MKIQLLYLSGCPSWEAALANLNVAIAGEVLGAPVELLARAGQVRRYGG